MAEFIFRESHITNNNRLIIVQNIKNSNNIISNSQSKKQIKMYLFLQKYQVVSLPTTLYRISIKLLYFENR